VNKNLQLAFVALCAALVAGSAMADDVPVKAPIYKAKESPDLPAGPVISLEASWERLYLPATKFGFLVAPNGSATPPIYNTVSKMTNHNGIFNGARMDAAFEGLRFDSGSMPGSIGLKGFYAGHHNDQASHCVPGDPPYCAIVPLFDPSPIDINNLTGGSGEQVQFDANRRANHWGVAAEFKTPIGGGNSLRSNEQPLAVKVGLAYRRIDQSLALNAVGDGSHPGNPAFYRFLAYTEGLDTSYWGGYIGFTGRTMLGNGVVLSLDGEVGLYDANSRYNGTYASSGWVFDPKALPALMTQTLALTHNQAAVIAALKLSADKNFGPFSLGVFARGEYYSYAPEMAYNDTQLDFLNGNRGINDGTSIAGGRAWTYSLGGKISVPLNGLPR
jgi:hypothetical protein